MSRVLRAGTAPGPGPIVRPAVRPAAEAAPKGALRSTAPTPAAPPRRFSFHDVPSGLASLVFHFSVLIVLGLVVTERSRPHLEEVVLNWDEGTNELAGGGGG